MASYAANARARAVLGVILSVNLASTSMAQADDPAPPGGALVDRANALFAEGRRLLAAGEISAACARFQESQRLLPRGGTLLNLGLCHEQEGKLPEARDELRAALEIARRDGRRDREPIASDHLATVESLLSQAESHDVPKPPDAPPPADARRPAPPPPGAPLPPPPALPSSTAVALPSRPTPRYVWAGAALTGALAITTAVVGVVSLDRRSDYLAMRTPALYERAAAIQHWATAAAIATAAVGTATLIFYWRRPEVPAPAVALDLGVGPGALLVRGRF